MPTTEVAFAIFDRCLAALGLIRERRKYRNERMDQALYALYTALNETKAYIQHLESGKKRDRKREQAIAKCWHDASVPLRNIDRDLAERCFMKGSYWLGEDSGLHLQMSLFSHCVFFDKACKHFSNQSCAIS